MPLLKKKSFEKASTTLLRDEEEVFFCEITGEVFRDYEEFSERLFLCNSMVWTCCMTGKQNLTYPEALESEENARRSLKEFPVELKIPILFLASKTKRSSFGEMADDVFLYTKDRYFIGENLETSFTGNKWKDSHVLQVIAPTEDQIAKEKGTPNEKEKHFSPPANLYKYEIEHLDAEDKDVSEIMIVDHSQIKRKKAVYSREKSKLFLKQFVEQNDTGTWVIKQSALESFGINKMKFDQIFDGPLPNFETSKKLEKKINGTVNGKRTKQETLAKFLNKNGLAGKPDKVSSKKSEKGGKDLLEAMKKREEEFKARKLMKEEEKLALKKKKREDNIKVSNYLKEWYKPKEDLELEDQMKLPIPAPVKCKVSDRYVGEMFMIMEFVEQFSKILNTKDFFPQGFTLEIMERALTEREVAGPLTDIIQMFLTAIFTMQEEESSQYNIKSEKGSEIKEETINDHLSLKDASHLATMASHWSVLYQGLQLAKLPLYSLTVSEILRIHLLSSGARINDTGARWRYQQRGGYTSEDDPGLHLRLHQPHILKALSIHNVVQLSLNDKLKILSCLMNQLLTYADVRDIVEERLDKTKQYKLDLRAAQAAERKRDMEYTTEKAKLKKESKEDPKYLADELEKLENMHEKKRVENERKIEKLVTQTCDKQTLLGSDRAFRKYVKLESVPGVFVNFEETEPGACLEERVKQNPDLVNADRNETINYIRKVFDGLNSSDKENECENSNPKMENKSSKSPLKSPVKINGINKKISEIEKAECNECNELLMCSADITSCLVHSTTVDRKRWSFFHEKEQIEQLVNALNKRGVRESELLQFVKCDKEVMMNLVAQTPCNMLNAEVEVDEANAKPSKNTAKKNAKNRYEDANLGYPIEMSTEDVLHNAIIDNILEMEDKIYAGNLGNLMVKNRDKWRDCLLNKKYDTIDRMIVKKDEKHLKVKKEEKSKGGSRSSTPEVPDEKKPSTKLYQDPGKFLGITLDIESDDSELDDDDIVLTQSAQTKKAIEGLAICLAQVANSVEQKYLKRPLGHGDMPKSDNKKDKLKYDILDFWEQSLIASTSFSQVFLHYGTLDSCVMWSRSALLARCRICRRQKDSENMLLCDQCNLGHHLYCLKPKLTQVPKGDWFCDRCKKEKEKEAALLSPEPTPQKKRKVFNYNEDSEEEEESDEGIEEGDEDDNEEEQSDSGEESPSVLELCTTCNSGGDLISCEKCETNYHKECVEPPLRRAPRGNWTCNNCKDGDKKEKETKEKGDQGWWQCTGFIYTQRRCAAKAINKIHNFTKSLRRISESSDSESESEEEVIQSGRRSHRREDNRSDLPLHNVALQELLTDVMKHKDAWPFLRPVQKNEVPDYYEVITMPMDFGTIKYKLNMGDYTEDKQLMKDAVLVFQNCNAYNDTDSDVYKCGQRLLKFFNKRCKEIGLKLPEEMVSEDDEETLEPPKSKKRRTK